MASGLAAAIEKRFGIVPELIEGSGGIFDVRVDGKRTLFSKHDQDRFPTEEEILTALADLRVGGQPG